MAFVPSLRAGLAQSSTSVAEHRHRVADDLVHLRCTYLLLMGLLLLVGLFDLLEQIWQCRPVSSHSRRLPASVHPLPTRSSAWPVNMITSTRGCSCLILLQHLHAVHPGHLHIQDNHVDAPFPKNLECVLAGRGGLYVLYTPFPEKDPSCRQEPLFIIHQKQSYRNSCFMSSFGGSSSGRVPAVLAGRGKTYREYGPHVLFAVDLNLTPQPLHDSEVVLSPKPVPSPTGFVVKKGRKILSMIFGSMPQPSSATEIRSPCLCGSS